MKDKIMAKIKNKSSINLAKDEDNSSITYFEWNNTKYDTQVMKLILVGLNEIDKAKRNNTLINGIKLILEHKDLQKLGINTQNNTKKELEELAKQSQLVSLRLETETGFKYMTMFPTVGYERGKFELTINNDIVKYYKILETNFTNLQLLMTANLTKPEMQLYLFLKDYLNNEKIKYNWKIKISIDQLKNILCCSGKYKDFKDLKKWRIIPTIKNINNSTDISIDKFYKIRGKDEIVFEFSWNKLNQNKNEYIPPIYDNSIDHLEIKNEEFNELKSLINEQK